MIDWDLLKKLVEDIPQTDPRSSRKSIPDSVRKAVEGGDGNKCKLCGREYEVNHLHHIQPYGPSIPENLVSICDSCHQVVHRLLYVTGKHRMLSAVPDGLGFMCVWEQEAEAKKIVDQRILDSGEWQ